MVRPRGTTVADLIRLDEYQRVYQDYTHGYSEADMIRRLRNRHDNVGLDTARAIINRVRSALQEGERMRRAHDFSRVEPGDVPVLPTPAGVDPHYEVRVILYYRYGRTREVQRLPVYLTFEQPPSR